MQRHPRLDRCEAALACLSDHQIILSSGPQVASPPPSLCRVASPASAPPEPLPALHTSPAIFINSEKTVRSTAAGARCRHRKRWGAFHLIRSEDNLVDRDAQYQRCCRSHLHTDASPGGAPPAPGSSIVVPVDDI